MSFQHRMLGQSTWHEATSVQVNHGEGWGIPVSRGLVLSKSVLQSLCVRFLLAGTVIKAFLDGELGLKDPPPASHRPHHGASGLQIILRNGLKVGGL